LLDSFLPCGGMPTPRLLIKGTEFWLHGPTNVIIQTVRPPQGQAHAEHILGEGGMGGTPDSIAASVHTSSPAAPGSVHCPETRGAHPAAAPPPTCGSRSPASAAVRQRVAAWAAHYLPKEAHLLHTHSLHANQGFSKLCPASQDVHLTGARYTHGKTASNGEEDREAAGPWAVSLRHCPCMGHSGSARGSHVPGARRRLPGTQC